MARALALIVCLLPAAARSAPVVVIRDATVVPMDREHVLPHHDVVIRGDRIAAVVPTGAPIPSGAT
ncbi:MAG TPA: hypothetical protein VD838_17350, partial [Anaeromyxobacteraceae bacterium]|nr:hypothetical protein [Anaeromyxobacteraceae bacterium]